jgi:hypothetical protein
MRPDWVVDFALTLPGVDTPRIGLPLIDPISAQRRHALYVARCHDIRFPFSWQCRSYKNDRQRS